MFGRKAVQPVGLGLFLRILPQRPRGGEADVDIFLGRIRILMTAEYELGLTSDLEEIEEICSSCVYSNEVFIVFGRGIWKIRYD